MSKQPKTPHAAEPPGRMDGWIWGAAQAVFSVSRIHAAPSLLIAGGAGIPPVRSKIRHPVHPHDDRAADLMRERAGGLLPKAEVPLCGPPPMRDAARKPFPISARRAAASTGNDLSSHAERSAQPMRRTTTSWTTAAVMAAPFPRAAGAAFPRAPGGEREEGSRSRDAHRELSAPRDRTPLTERGGLGVAFRIPVETMGLFDAAGPERKRGVYRLH
jgi:hypothetical protein